MSRDPFYAVKDKVSDSLNRVNVDITSLSSLSNRSAGFNTLAASVKSTLSTIEGNLNDLSQTIVIVEKHRARFANITDDELENRRQYVRDTQEKLNEFQSTLRQLQQKSQVDTRANLVAQSSNSRFSAGIASNNNREQDDFVQAAHSQQQTLINKQDIVLEDMEHALARLGNLSNDIQTELITQGDMLNELDESMDEAQGQMNIVLKKMDKILKTSDRGRICCIIGLFLVAVILLGVIVFT
jgi:syntaxin 6